MAPEPPMRLTMLSQRVQMHGKAWGTPLRQEATESLLVIPVVLSTK